MTTTEQGQPVSLDYLAGRIDGQETQFQILQAGQQQIREEMIAGQQQIRADMDSRIAEVNARIDQTSDRFDARLRELREEIREVRAAQRQLIIANWTIGGAILVALIGMIVAIV